MTPERWRQISEIFHAAIERDQTSRERFLEDACRHDPTLRAEVDALVAAHGVAGSFGHALGGMMPLPAGTRLGFYEIQELIGAGGMGEVYRARDTRLGRDVAIKILPRAFVADADRLARFDREARLLAALNHPHIATLYGVEEADGVQALVLELVEGPTLAERLARGPLPVTEALAVASQIADALEAAHEKGIIHRDLKPGNIKVKRDGTVKVLDFGIAKVWSSDHAMLDLSQLSTMTASGTQQGVIIGTAAYMSPEQARGLMVDKRTDVWGFGCVLFEMLTGRMAFAGDTTSDTIARILERDPDWSALPAATPPGVAQLLRRCLDKDSKRRWHDIADARIEIDDALKATSSAAGEARSVRAERSTGRPRRATMIGAGLVAVVMTGALAWIIWMRPRADTSPRFARTTISSPRAGVGAGSSLAITSDGTRLVYAGNGRTQLLMRALDDLESTVVFTSPVPLNWVFLSPDDKRIGFVQGNRLEQMAFTGGPSTFLTETRGVLGATWLQDNSIVFADEDPAVGLQRVSSAGGPATILTRPDAAKGEADHIWPEALPGGRGVLYTVTATTGGLDAAQIKVFDFTTGKSTLLVAGGTHARYVSTGHLIYVVGRTLRVIPFDLARLQVVGTPTQVVSRVATDGQGGSLVSVAADGTLAYVDAPVRGATPITMVWVDRHGGGEVPLGAPAGTYGFPRLSPDGTRVAFSDGADIFIWDLAHKKLDQLTSDPTTDFFPAWMDNQYLVFYSNRGNGGIYRQRADGTGSAERISADTGGEFLLPSSVTPDGTRVLFSLGGQPLGRQDLMALLLDGTKRVQLLIQTPAYERNGIVSPDSRWLAYESDTSGQFEVYVQPWPDVNASQPRRVSAAGGMKPLWAPKTGRELFYVALDGAVMAVRVEAHDAVWSAGPATKVIDGPYLTRGAVSARTYDVSLDGQRFLMLKLPPFDPATSAQIVVERHWLEQLQRPK